MKHRFVNLDGSGPHPLSSVLRWSLLDRVAGRRRKAPARAVVPCVDPDLDAIRAAPSKGEGARLTWIGHASWLVQLDGLSLLIDPVFRDSIGPGVSRNVPPGVAVQSLPAIDAQLVTHNHRDHLDVPSLREVNRPVIAGTGHSDFFRRVGLGCTELGWWESTSIGDVTISFVPSQHWSRRGLSDTNETLWGGFVIQGSSAVVYHSGDTAYFDGFAEIGRRFPAIDAAMLPIGAYDPEWFMGKQHMNPEQAVQTFVDLGAQAFFAMHWGTFKLTDEPLLEPPERLDREWERRSLDPAKKHILAVGQSKLVRRLSRLVSPPRRAAFNPLVFQLQERPRSRGGRGTPGGNQPSHGSRRGGGGGALGLSQRTKSNPPRNPPMCAKKATPPCEALPRELIPWSSWSRNQPAMTMNAGRSKNWKKMKIGTRTVTLARGNSVMYAARTPAIAPEAPTIGTRDVGSMSN